MAPTEQKALFLEKKFGDLAIGTAAVPKPGKDEVLVKIHSSALNPVDWKIKKYGFGIENFPSVLGTDIAGEVVELGEGVAHFAIGDRVFFQGLYNDNKYSGFQQYTLADTYTLGKIPSNLSYDEASTIALTLTTSYIGLYNDHPFGFGFDAPVDDAAKGKYKDTPIVVIGGSSSVGQFAIQLAQLSGFSPIITTASLVHTEFLKSLGASYVLDRKFPLSKESIETITDKPIKAVFDSISTEETQKAGLNLLVPGGQLGVVLSPSPFVEDEAPKKKKIVVQVSGRKTTETSVAAVRGLFKHVTFFLEDGILKPNRPEVLPGGLGAIADGLKRLEQDKVSGVKLVVHPQETAET